MKLGKGKESRVLDLQQVEREVEGLIGMDSLVKNMRELVMSVKEGSWMLRGDTWQICSGDTGICTLVRCFVFVGPWSLGCQCMTRHNEKV